MKIMLIFFCNQFSVCLQIFCSKFIQRSICHIFFTVSSSVNFDHRRWFCNIQNKTNIILSLNLQFVLAECTFQYKHTKLFRCHIEFRSTNPLCTVPCRNTTIHKSGFEPGRGLCLFFVLVPDSDCHIISCFRLQYVTVKCNSCGIICRHFTTIPDIHTACCFSYKNLCFCLHRILFFGFQFPGKYRFLYIQSKCFCDLIHSQIIYFKIFITHFSASLCCGILSVNSILFCNCSVPSQLRVKMHSKSPSVMAFCLICLGILAKTCQNTSRDTTFWIVTLHQITFLKSPYRNVRFFRIL